jgi:hypothetical protein
MQSQPPTPPSEEQVQLLSSLEIKLRLAIFLALALTLINLMR